jgi:preprotein translocase subunit YajC
MKYLIPADPIFIMDVVLFVLCSILLSFISYALYRTYKTEKGRKEYEPKMKTGDDVYAPVISGNINGKILEIRENTVIMSIEVQKSRIYQQ